MCKNISFESPPSICYRFGWGVAVGADVGVAPDVGVGVTPDVGVGVTPDVGVGVGVRPGVEPGMDVEPGMAVDPPGTGLPSSPLMLIRVAREISKDKPKMLTMIMTIMRTVRKSSPFGGC